VHRLLAAVPFDDVHLPRRRGLPSNTWCARTNHAAAGRKTRRAEDWIG
jgi:hypothetical protein